MDILQEIEQLRSIMAHVQRELDCLQDRVKDAVLTTDSKGRALVLRNSLYYSPEWASWVAVANIHADISGGFVEPQTKEECVEFAQNIMCEHADTVKLF